MSSDFKIMKYLFGFSILFIHISVWSQPDTIALKSQVDNIETEKNHVDFWDFIFERDQNMRNSPQIGQIDIENLILVSWSFTAIAVATQKISFSKSSHKILLCMPE